MSVKEKKPRTSASASNGAGRDWRQLSKLFEALPPHAIEAEMGLLGSVLVQPEVLGDVIFVVRNGDDFYKPANGAIYNAMVELFDKYSSVDIVQLNQLLVDRKVLDAVGGIGYLVELTEAMPNAANAVHYARLVREKALVRRLIGAAGDILHDAYHSDDEAHQVLDRAESLIFHIAQQNETREIQDLATLLHEEIRRIESNDKGLLTGVPTGYHELDELTTGCQKGEMIILAARPSMGKTALALNLAENMAMAGHAVGFFSLEMSKQQLVQRMLCARAGIQSQKVRRGMCNTNDFHALARACDELVNAPLFIDDTPGLTILQLRAKARRMAQQRNIQALFVDYLQLLTSGTRAESRQVEVSEISRGVKALARDLNVPVICLSQLNRGPEDRVGNRPRMSDLRESGSLEQDADVVMLLHREDYYHKDDENWKAENPEKIGVAELIISKQRNGPTGTVDLTWQQDCTRFRSHAYGGPPAGWRDSNSITEPLPSSRHPAAAKPSSTTPAVPFRDGGGPDRESDDEFGVPF